VKRNSLREDKARMDETARDLTSSVKWCADQDMEDQHDADT